MTDTNDDEEKCVDGLGVIGRAKAGLRDPLRLLNRHPLRHRRHHHNYHCHRHHCFYRQHPIKTSQELRMLSPSLCIQRSQCYCSYCCSQLSEM